jgi:CHASE3 domain sensor protein
MRFQSPEGAALFNLALSLCCLLGLTGSAFFLAQEQRDTDTLVRRSQEIVSHVTQLQQLTLDAESTGRAYLLIAEPELLQRYQNLLPLIDREVAAIAGLLADDSSELAGVDNIRRGLDTRYSFLTRLTKLRATQGLQAVSTLASRGTDREETAYVVSVLTEL